MTRYWVRGLGRWLITHPADVPRVLRAAWRLRRRHWWRHAPWLPVPARDYWEFRVTTAMGAGAAMTARDVVAVARWSVRQDVRG